MKKIKSKQVLIRVPTPLLKRVDAAAKEQCRSRTAEVCLRLADSLKTKKVPNAEVAAA